MPTAFLVRIFFWAWFGGAIAAGHFQILQRAPAVITPVATVGIALLLLVVYSRVSAVRRWLDTLDVRALVLIHVTRFTGIYLLMLHQRGVLPRGFAMPGGVTDIIVATMALPIALAPLPDQARRRAVVIWNVVGFLGLAIATIGLARIGLSHPTELRTLTYLPLSLLPTFLMPLLIATHVIIFDRIRREGGGA